jgi:ParB-like chromosome segregation protein Spo0J
MIAALSENMARNEFIDPIAEGRTYDALTHQGYTQAVIAREISRTQQYVSGRISLLRLDPEIQALITSGRVSAEHGIELSRLDARTGRVLMMTPDFQNSSQQTKDLTHIVVQMREELDASKR